MAKVQTWLEKQHRDGVHGTFLCNWRLTLRLHEEGELLVYIDDKSGDPVAYQWGDLLQPGILEVRNDMRGRGIGKALVAHRLAQAAKAGKDILFIQCKPSSSIAFWTRMGFDLLPNDRENHAVRYMHRKLTVPEDGSPVQVLVEWYPEDRKWEPATLAARTQNIPGVVVNDEVHLTERALCTDCGREGDLVVRVCVDGREWYFDKAKYAAGDELGITRCTNGFYLDMLHLVDQNSSD